MKLSFQDALSFSAQQGMIIFILRKTNLGQIIISLIVQARKV